MSNRPAARRPWFRDDADDDDSDSDDAKKKVLPSSFSSSSSYVARGAASASPSVVESEPKQKTTSVVVVAADDAARRRRRQLEADNLSARLASNEAVEIGRSTAERIDSQSEQIARADDLADRTSAVLDRSHRTLRGMTWSGWFANLIGSDGLSSNISGGFEARDSDDDDPASRLRRGRGTTPSAATTPPRNDAAAEDDAGDVPERFEAARDALTNYARNVRVLEECETSEQRSACSTACDGLYRRAEDELRRLQSAAFGGDVGGAFYGRLVEELGRVRDAQLRAEGRSGEEPGGGGVSAGAVPFRASNERRVVVAPRQRANRSRRSPSLRCDDDTEEHLSILSQNLTELRSIGENLRESVVDQNDALDALNDKSDSLVDRTKMVTRRADRLARKANWRPEPAEFLAWHAIRHVDTDKYLAASADGSVELVDEFSPNAAFGLWKRGKCVVGLQHRTSRRYVGRSMWTGRLVCTSYDFGKREELEVDEETADDEEGGTTILCASANWGSGGYVRVRSDGETFEIGGGSDGGRKKASLWRFVALDA